MRKPLIWHAPPNLRIPTCTVTLKAVQMHEVLESPISSFSPKQAAYLQPFQYRDASGPEGFWFFSPFSVFRSKCFLQSSKVSLTPAKLLNKWLNILSQRIQLGIYASTCLIIALYLKLWVKLNMPWMCSLMAVHACWPCVGVYIFL